MDKQRKHSLATKRKGYFLLKIIPYYLNNMSHDYTYMFKDYIEHLGK